MGQRTPRPVRRPATRSRIEDEELPKVPTHVGAFVLSERRPTVAIKRCKSSFAASVRGVPRVMKTGALVNDDDPILKGREHLFEDAELHVQERASRVEQATAEPGR